MNKQIQCAYSNLDIQEEVLYLDKEGYPLGVWPLYYFGAGPHNPQDANVYFANVYCANEYHKEKANATSG